MKTTNAFAVIQQCALWLLLSTLYRPEAARRRVRSFSRPVLLLGLALNLQFVIIQTAKADSWTATGFMQTARANHTATLLPDGKVLVAGGFGTNGIALALGSVELYDPVTGTWIATAPMNTARGLHTATLLPNGQVLVVGGYKNYKSALASAELYDPVSGTWTNTGSLNTARWSHLATLLPNGKVLVLGGINSSGNLASAELYDPASGTWTNTGSLSAARYESTATLLPDGMVLVAGGYATGGTYLASAELYDPVSGTWTNTGSLNTARGFHSATLLPNGNVLVMGGLALVMGGGGISSQLTSAELYNPAGGTWTNTGPLNTGRWSFPATLLSGGQVLVAGGSTTNSTYSAGAELYDPVNGTWTNTGSLNIARGAHTATLLPNGNVLAAGGYTSSAGSSVTNSAELYGATNTIDTNLPTATMDWNTVYQRIDGFGASSAWQHTWTPAQADMFFSTNSGTGLAYNGTNFSFTGIGLSLLRNHIAYANTPLASDTPSTVETNMMQMAQARGARVWSTPWTPAAGFKSINDIYDTNIATGGGINGGSYLGGGNNATNLAYASQLANYVVSMKTNYGIILYALSVQNEPDANVTSYEACQWSSAQIHDFVTNLYNALAAQGVGSTKIIIPEGESWQGSSNLYTATMSDPVSAADVGIIADHNYNSIPPSGTPIQLASSGLPAWETETANLSSGNNGSMVEGIYWANRIHLFMTVAQANAWHFWWLMGASSSGYDNSNQGLADTNGVPAKRMYVLGQYSRFVRPDYYRIGATNTGAILVSAYQDTNSGNFAVVAINADPSNSIDQTFTFPNAAINGPVTPWITSATLSLCQQAPIIMNGSFFSYQMPPLSVVTFVGQAFSGAIPTTIILVNPIELGNGSVQLAFTNTPGATFTVLSATNLSLPLSNWTVLGGVTEISPGHFQFTDPQATNHISRFYRVKSP
ncbi:MAG TPA: kelch repeat-containing protein [Candidatus Sulfopaludibacter sp.]|nr:kelch repeat-containing protein [Candidatus Sulfopaludibacter sp.]